MRQLFLSILMILALCAQLSAKSRFDELEKEPEGAHKGQMILTAIVSVGGAVGPGIAREKDFAESSVYEVVTDTYKKLWLSHFHFSAGVAFEYMPINHLGIKIKLKGDFVQQRTRFGSDFENWSLSLYRAMTVAVGPVGHLTNRKRWDVTLNPVIGYSFGGYQAAPVARELINSDLVGSVDEQLLHMLTFGAELNFSIFFSGGFVLSLGFDWNMYIINQKNPFNLTNNQNGQTYPTETKTSFHNLSFILSVGYAFKN
jgi:hypothetical protein